MMPIKFENISLDYPNFSLRDINFSLDKNEIITIAGKNGSGKTTLLESISGIRRRARGFINFENKTYPISSIPFAVKKEIFLFSEDLPYFSNLTIIENLRYFALLHDKNIDSNEFEVLMKKVGLSDYKKKFSDLSKGMRQRMRFLELMLINPKLVLFDEPTIGLDPAGKADFYSLISEIKKGNSSIEGAIVASNDLDFIKEFNNKIIFLSNGKIVLSGNSVNDILNKFKNDYFAINISNVSIENLNKLNNMDGAIFSGSRLLLPKRYENIMKNEYAIEEIALEDLFRVDENGIKF